MENVKILKDLRAEWMRDRDKHTHRSDRWWAKQQGVYALDEAIKSLKNDKVSRYGDDKFIIKTG